MDLGCARYSASECEIPFRKYKRGCQSDSGNSNLKSSLLENQKMTDAFSDTV